ALLPGARVAAPGLQVAHDRASALDIYPIDPPADEERGVPDLQRHRPLVAEPQLDPDEPPRDPRQRPVISEILAQVPLESRELLGLHRLPRQRVLNQERLELAFAQRLSPPLPVADAALPRGEAGAVGLEEL